jgi:sterol desaturase/sphingolipid hydroxylase (fatty acid hydroxylase superfamily)
MPDAELRLGVFFGVWLLLLLAESGLAFAANDARWRRAARHLTLAAIGSLLTRLLLPLGAIGAATFAAAHGVGLLQLWNGPTLVEWGLAWIALDALMYLQHRLMHRIPWLWRLHRVHHTDRDLDASTALRFHPLEIALSMGFKMLAVIALGAEPEAVLLFEILLNASALFAHANLRLPDRIERVLGAIVVTPATHRVHHAPDRLRTDSNYGSVLVLWDRLFGSYRGQRRAPDGQGFGVAEFADRDDRVLRLLAQPWVD